MKKRKLCIIGHFGGGKDLHDGQTVKTLTLYNGLKRYADCDILCVDTYDRKCHPIRLLMYSLYCIAGCDPVLVLLSINGRKFYFPLLYTFAKIAKKKIYHDNIGGSLHERVKDNPKWIKYMQSFEINWLEFQSMADKLVEAGLKNVEVLPNFKDLKIAEPCEIVRYSTPPYRFCTFSRVSEAKGIPAAITAVENINRKYGYEIARLDIYGSPDDEYKDEFDRLMASVTGAVAYRGTVPYDQSVKVLQAYFALLFPTNFSGEGFPGTVIDAYASGLPVIATDWHANSEIIENGVTGIIYPDNSFLEQTLIAILEDPEKINVMKATCLQRADEYTLEKNIKRIIEKLGL